MNNCIKILTGAPVHETSERRAGEVGPFLVLQIPHWTCLLYVEIHSLILLRVHLC